MNLATLLRETRFVAALSCRVVFNFYLRYYVLAKLFECTPTCLEVTIVLTPSRADRSGTEVGLLK